MKGAEKFLNFGSDILLLSRQAGAKKFQSKLLSSTGTAVSQQEARFTRIVGSRKE